MIQENTSSATSDQSFVRRPICLCAICGTDVFVGDDLVEKKVYKCGDLSYISIWHRQCERNRAQTEIVSRPVGPCEGVTPTS